MASSLFVLLDDIATILDDLSVMTQAAAKKSAGVLGDDLALNAEQVTGVESHRELHVVWSVAKGSAVNKTVLVPGALAISAFAPGLVTPLLLLGGAFLCFEGVEKLAHKFLHADPEHEKRRVNALSPEEERAKIRGAVRTDFVLSAEIVVITLGTVADEPIAMQFGVLVAIAALMTVGVYGLVAGIVKLDDLGILLRAREGRTLRAIGRAILVAAPWLMRGLSIAGTIAMFLVGGGILVHGVEPLHHFSHELFHSLGQPWRTGGAMLFDGGLGVILGAVVLAVVLGVKRFSKSSAA